VLEPQRSHYLRALGVDVYVPRVILPGAKASQACVWDSALPVEAELPIGVAAVAAVVADVQRSLPVTKNVNTKDIGAKDSSTTYVENIDLAPPSLPIIADNTPVDTNSSAIAAAPKFALSVVVSDGGILVLDDAPTTANRAEYLRLLANIFFALQGRAAQPQLDVFLWPMQKRPQLDQSAAAAQETLAAHVQNQIQQHAIHTVLLLGEATQRWCGIEVSDSLRCCRSISALACLQAPENKRRLWADIRHLATAR
jgi:hypothetical protein